MLAWSIQQACSSHGHIITYSIYRIDVVPYTQVINLNIPTTIPSNVYSSSSILIVILAGEFFNHLMTLLMLMQLDKKTIICLKFLFSELASSISRAREPALFFKK